jgi:hypothetical protein
LKTLFISVLILLSCRFCLAKQQVNISNISFNAQTENDINCLAVTFDVALKYTFNQLLLQGDSSKEYLIEVYLKKNGLLNANRGYPTYRSAEGKVKAVYVVPLSNDVRNFERITLLVPFGAIDIPDGEQTIKPVFVIRDPQAVVLATNAGNESFRILFPPRINLRVWIKEIEVAQTDFKEELWDYFLLDTVSARPDVCWSVLLGLQKINRSGHTRDSFVYSDPDAKEAVDFTISKNDIFSIAVYDYDMMSFSDDVGNKRMGIDSLTGETTKLSGGFGKVLRMECEIKRLPMETR